MANSKSAIKRARQSEERNLRNRHYKSRIKTAVKKFQKALDEAPEQGQLALREAVSELDRAASKGVVHANVARRKKARLARALNRQASEES